VMSMKKCSELCLSIFARCSLLRCFPWKLLITSIHLLCMDNSVKIKCTVYIHPCVSPFWFAYLSFLPSYTSNNWLTFWNLNHWFSFYFSLDVPLICLNMSPSGPRFDSHVVVRKRLDTQFDHWYWRTLLT